MTSSKLTADVVGIRRRKSFADGAATIKAKGDKGMSDLVVDPFENEQASNQRFQPMASSPSIRGEHLRPAHGFITVWQA